MDDDQTGSSAAGTDSDSSSSAYMRVDYRVFEVEVEGGEDDSAEDLNEIVAERLKKGMEDIEDLKRTDYNLEDEFDVERTSPNGKMMQ